MSVTTISISTPINGKPTIVTVHVTTKLGFDESDEKAIVAACMANKFHNSKKLKGTLPSDMIGYVHAPANHLFLVTQFERTKDDPPTFTITIPKAGKVKAGVHRF